MKIPGASKIPPQAPTHPVTDIYHGHAIVDPYRWMEDLKSADTVEWMKAQSEYARSYLDQLPMREALLQRLNEVSNAGPTITGIQRRSQRLFYFRLDPGDNDRKIYMREDIASPERLLINPEELSTAEEHFSITSFSVSPNGQYLSYLISGGGSEFGDVHVIETNTGQPTGDRIEYTRWDAGWWLPDNRSFAYLRFQSLAPGTPQTERYKKIRVYLHILGTDPVDDKPLFGCDIDPSIRFNEELIPFMDIPLGSKYAFVIVNSGVSPNSAFYCAPVDDLHQAHVAWQQVASFEDEISRALIHDDKLYLLTYHDTPRYKLMCTDLAGPNLVSASVVFPASEAVIENFVTAKDALYVQTLEGGLRRLHRVGYTHTSPQTLSLPYSGAAEIAVADTLEDGLLFTLHSWTKSPALYLYDPASQTSVDTQLIPPIPVDMSEIEATNVKAPSHDGVLIPMVILHRRNLKRDGTHPTLLNGYGAYGIENTAPIFIPELLAWLEQGGIYAYAGVRGGGEYGEEWHLAGKQATKPNTWKDFIACAEYLVQNQYTNSPHLAGQGTSAGGILIGNAIAECPDLFGAAIINVGCNNALRMETTANGVPNIPEFGSVQTEEGFKALLEMDAYHKIKDGVRYPAVMLTHGINDPRVEPWLSAKMAARLQQVMANDKAVLLRLDYDGGHGIGSTKPQRNARLADTFAFLLYQLSEAV